MRTNVCDKYYILYKQHITQNIQIARQIDMSHMCKSSSDISQACLIRIPSLTGVSASNKR